MPETVRDADKNWPHIHPKYLIRSSRDFIVWIDDELDIDWQSSDEYDAEGHEDSHKHNLILNEAAALETTPCDALATSMKTHFKRLIGEAITRSFDHDYPSAGEMLEAARAYILARSQETSRFWYLSAAFGMVAPFVVAGGCLWLWREPLTGALGESAFWLLLSAVAGSLGALLSVIGRTGKLEFDCSAGRALHYLEGTSRIWAGALSGVVAGAAVNTEMILAPLSRGERTHAVMMLAALAAGTGERLATSIISTIGAAHPKAAGEERG